MERKSTRRSLRFLALIIAMLPVLQPAAQEKADYDALVQANTRFAFNFLREVLARNAEGNILIAPTALSADFALLQNGADTKTRKEILTAFDLSNLSSEEINKQSLALRRSFDYSTPTASESSRQFDANEAAQSARVSKLVPEHLVLAGSLWAQPRVAFRPEFLKTSEKFYSFETMSVPNRGPAAVSAVNSWVARHTGGALTHVLDSWEGDDFLLVDTTWFKGGWVQPFAVRNTHLGEFSLLSGRKKQIRMMARHDIFSYFRGAKFQAVRLPYHHAAMYIFLPSEDSNIKEFEQSLTAQGWAAWMPDFQNQQGYIEVPRFHCEYRAFVNSILKDLGVERAFTSFGSFAPAVSNPEGAVLTRVLQSVVLRVDEEGTEVASAGVIGGVIGGVAGGPRPQPFRMIVNRPFFLVISDNRTGAILYMGVIAEPQSD